MEAKKFIKLHNVDDNEPVIVNTNEINTVLYSSNGRYSTITFINDNDFIEVKESVDKIYQMMYEEVVKPIKN